MTSCSELSSKARIVLQDARNVIALALENGAWSDESSGDQDSKDEVLSVLAEIDEVLDGDKV